MILIGMTGRAGSGKDAAANILVQERGFQKTAFAKPIKDGCRAMFGLIEEQLYGDLKEVVIPEYGCSPREILQWAGSEFGRQMVHPDIWLMQVERQWEDLQALDPQQHFCAGLVVADVRFENEAAMIRRLGGLVVHVQRPEEQITSKVEYAGHVSEAGVKVLPEDVILDNSGSLMRLRRTAMHIADAAIQGRT